MTRNQNIVDSILNLVGETPLVKLNRVAKHFKGSYFAKLEAFNPGLSQKDRIALHIIENAEKKGIIKKNSTIVETTSGNTGYSLAMISLVKGYKCILAVSDKSSQDKIDLLKTMGAEVHVCPANVPADDSRSYYEVAKRIHKETPNSIYINQYFNELNTEAHYRTTGPEIWEQTGGKITHFVVGVGTGGTISGVAKYLKEKNPMIKIWGIDTYGSVFKKFHETGIFDETEIYPYITEGIGEDIIPKNVNFELIDKFEKVTDEDAAIYTRKLAKQEGIFAGNSCGAAVKGVLQLKENFTKNDVVVVLLHDSGSRYIGKIYNDDWMIKNNFSLD